LRHPASGAGNIKGDGHDEHHLYEVKLAGRSFTLNARDLRRDYIRAIRQGRVAKWLVYFSDEGFTAEIRLVPGGQELIEE
jgi:hypothetical protein